MTATRWWVRLTARWLARIDGVSGQLRLAFLGMTGVSAVLGVLKYYGFQQFAPVFLLLVGAGLLAFAYLYTEGGVWNQMARDRQDLSTNYSGPTDLVGHRIGLQQLAYLGYLVQANGNGPDDLDTIREEMTELTHEEWARLRDGAPLRKIEEEADP